MNRPVSECTHKDTEFIALDDIAAQTGLTVDEVRCGGATLFSRLAERGGDLTSAIVAACAASGIRPERMIKLLPSFAAALEQSEKKGLPGQTSPKNNGKDAK